jgi:hypothetical protein
MKKQIELGNKVKDIVSGLIGIVVQKTEYLNGCVQYGVTPPVKKDSTDIVTYSIDEQQLEYVGPGVKKENKEKKEVPGGPPKRFLTHKLTSRKWIQKQDNTQ